MSSKTQAWNKNPLRTTEKWKAAWMFMMIVSTKVPRWRIHNILNRIPIDQATLLECMEGQVWVEQVWAEEPMVVSVRLGLEVWAPQKWSTRVLDGRQKWVDIVSRWRLFLKVHYSWFHLLQTSYLRSICLLKLWNRSQCCMTIFAIWELKSSQVKTWSSRLHSTNI